VWRGGGEEVVGVEGGVVMKRVYARGGGLGRKGGGGTRGGGGGVSGGRVGEGREEEGGGHFAAEGGGEVAEEGGEGPVVVEALLEVLSNSKPKVQRQRLLVHEVVHRRKTRAVRSRSERAQGGADGTCFADVHGRN
jgi:hypothetical protein